MMQKKPPGKPRSPHARFLQKASFIRLFYSFFSVRQYLQALPLPSLRIFPSSVSTERIALVRAALRPMCRAISADLLYSSSERKAIIAPCTLSNTDHIKHFHQGFIPWIRNSALQHLFLTGTDVPRILQTSHRQIPTRSSGATYIPSPSFTS